MGLLDRLFGRRTDDARTKPQAKPPLPRPQRSAPSFAIVDVETTGLSPRTDRIIELAVVHVDAQGRVVDEWTTRFNPERPVGATHIHGITDADVANAPLFRDFAPSVATRLAGLPVAAHNASFDLAFLRAEFGTAGWDVPFLPSFCTLHASHHYMPNLERRRLVDCCWAAGITVDNAHSALGDARATAGLMNRYLTDAPVHPDLLMLPAKARTVAWPSGPSRPPAAPRAAASRPLSSRPVRITPARPKQQPLIKQLTALSLLEVIDEGAPDGTMAYLETLLDCLEDGTVSRLTAMLVTDGSFAGGKLAKATEVGTRVVHPDVFEVLVAHLQPALLKGQPSIVLGRTDGVERSEVDPTLPTASPAAVRAWAAQNGYVVGVRGRLPADVLDAFRRESLASMEPTAMNETEPKTHG